MKFTLITVNLNQMDGVPCIRGLRIPLATVVSMVAEGMNDEEILEAFPDLEKEDIREALHYAACVLQERELPFIVTVLEETKIPSKRRISSASIAGKAKTLGDLISPIIDEQNWECLK